MNRSLDFMSAFAGAVGNINCSTDVLIKVHPIRWGITATVRSTLSNPVNAELEKVLPRDS